MDSSFLFLPFGNDILVVALVARHHDGYPWYVLSAVCGSVLGVLILDLVARKIGEEGVRRVAGESRFNYLKGKIEKSGGGVIALACLAPPPFPFTMVIAANSTLGYPQRRLLWIVALARAARFLILGALAIEFGREILRITSSEPFRWTMIVFTFICLAGSVLSIVNWVHRGYRRVQPEALRL